MNYEDTLIAMLAPQDIIEAAKRLDANEYRRVNGKVTGAEYRKHDEDALAKWYNQAAGQNRYGK